MFAQIRLDDLKLMGLLEIIKFLYLALLIWIEQPELCFAWNAYNWKFNTTKCVSNVNKNNNS